MKRSVAILSLALFACNSGKNETEQNTAQTSAKEIASDMSNGATDAAANATDASYKKYDVKSGIVTLETTMEMSGMNIKTKNVLYFDDYGNKECQEEYKVDESGKEILSARDFVKDGYRYVCSVENKGGSRSKANGYGVAAAFNMKEAETLKDNQFKKIGDESICGKTCSAFSMVTPSGNIKMYGWSGITLKTIVENPEMKMKTSTVATKFEENAVIPADKFEVPAGVKMTDM
jgi:hypothetical protein